MMTIKRITINVSAKTLVVVAGMLALPALAGVEVTNSVPQQWVVSARWDNDTFGGSDRYYTDGVALSLTQTGPNWLDPLADWLPWGQGRRTVGYDVAQLMFTPDNKTLHNPDPKDRPYAGILAVGLSLHVEQADSYNGLKLVVGVIGPDSLADKTQKEVHRQIGDTIPQGWDQQLKNEPIVNLAYEYRHKFRLAGEREAWSVEGFPLAGGWLGNMLTQAQFGGVVRAGYNMPDDFGPTLVRGMDQMPPPRRSEKPKSNSDWGFSIYGGALANLVLRDITLDGNTFEDSRSVDKKWFVPAEGVGICVGNRRFQTSFTYVFWGDEFDGQPKHSEYGAITASYFF
jgi:lipid A 3-O-deacylase